MLPAYIFVINLSDRRDPIERNGSDLHREDGAKINTCLPPLLSVIHGTAHIPWPLDIYLAVISQD